MKNYLIYALIGASVIAGVVTVGNSIKKKNTTSLNQVTSSQSASPQPTGKQQEKEEGKLGEKAVKVFEGHLNNLCGLFTKEKIEELSGKTFVNVEPKTHKELSFTQYLCSYYQEEAKYGKVSKVNIAKRITIGIIEGKKQIIRAQEGYKELNYTTKKDASIPFNHMLVFDEKGKFHHLDLLLTDDYKLVVETWWSLLSNDEALNFVKKLALYLKDLTQGSSSSLNEQKSSSSKTASSGKTVPLPYDEDIIRNFVSQIEEGKADQAARMMKINEQSPDQSNSELQTWAVQFSNITSFKLLKMEKANESKWTDKKHIYKVVFDVWMDPRSADAPIPYYGWQNGKNTRWLTLEKVGNLWKIAEIATGP